MASGSGTATRGKMKSSAKASPGSGKAKGQSFYDKTRRNAVTKQMQQNYSKGKG